MESEKGSGFNVYKGLQRPLIFKSLKGKYIYWGMACLLVAFVTGILLSTIIHPVAGIIGLIVIGLGGMGFIHSRQKGGLHSKTKSNGTYIVSPYFKRHSNR
ncbi:DUF4133 domain-containing protein [Adhaeribacter arboris]|uniref:DUF4133 domain-containing protein n=1 Tax=Adhaeribacter arboris TaxID=2072846 RepID=A0A2T2Y932_9BACT|nr:DUF4133 domain-containing protein [Adhaeribacter arboris]PSR51928.1 DUF4133 domain-containing protein [Adhaeribacter arboris]